MEDTDLPLVYPDVFPEGVELAVLLELLSSQSQEKCYVEEFYLRREFEA